MLIVKRKSKFIGTSVSCLILVMFYCLPFVLASELVSSDQTASAINLPDIPQVEKLLNQHYKVSHPLPSSANSYYAMVSRASQRDTLDWLDSKYRVVQVQDFDTARFFQRQKLLLVTVNYILLEAGTLPGMRSTGIFAYDGTNLTYLNGPDSLNNVTALLKRERRSLNEADASRLAELFSDTILRQENDKISLLQPLKEVSKSDAPDTQASKKKLQRPCECGPSRAELEKYGEQITRPQLTGDAKNGWNCHFVGLRGWMYKESRSYPVVAYDIFISPTFDVTVKEKVLEKKQP